MISDKRGPKENRGTELGTALGINEATLFEVLVSQYEAAGYEVVTGNSFETKNNDGYKFIECKNSEEKMEKVGDTGACFITYFNQEGTRITEIKLLIEEVKEIIVEKKGKYVI